VRLQPVVAPGEPAKGGGDLLEEYHGRVRVGLSASPRRSTSASSGATRSGKAGSARSTPAPPRATEGGRDGSRGPGPPGIVPTIILLIQFTASAVLPWARQTLGM
jgi:hypothetical protein